MSLRRLYEVPKFVSTVSESLLNQIKTDEGRNSLEAYSELKEGQAWMGALIVEMNNSLVDIQETRNAAMTNTKAFLIALVTGTFSSFFGASLVYAFHFIK